MVERQYRDTQKLIFLAPRKCPTALFGPLANGRILKQLHVASRGKSKSGKTGFAAKTGPARRAIRVSEYYRSPQPPGGVNSNNDGSDPTPMHEATKENLLALIAESDDDEELLS